jgi:uncharacterized protein RhaS with RHS repeats
VVVVGRYYDPATGQFLSVDPMVSKSQMSFAYANDNPVGQSDPSGKLVIGVCGGIAIALGGAFDGSVCLARTRDEPWDDIGFLRTVGFGFGVGSSVSVGLLISNADRIGDLAGWFNDAALGVGLYGVNVFWGQSPLSHKTVWGVVLQRGASTGGAVSYDWTYTWASVERNRAIANPLRWAWDAAIVALGGYANAKLWLGFAKAFAHL